MHDAQQRIHDPSDEELIAALHVRGHVQRVRGADASLPLLGPSVADTARALSALRRSGLGEDVPHLYQLLLDVIVASEWTAIRLLVSYPDLKPRSPA